MRGQRLAQLGQDFLYRENAGFQDERLILAKPSLSLIVIAQKKTARTIRAVFESCGFSPYWQASPLMSSIRSHVRVPLPVGIPAGKPGFEAYVKVM